MGFDVDKERELELYCVARFSSRQAKDQLVKDLMSVALSVERAEVCARVERVAERFRIRSSDNALTLIDRATAKARIDHLQKRFKFVNQRLPRGSKFPPWLTLAPWPRSQELQVDLERVLDQLEPSAVTMDRRVLYAISDVEQILQLFIEQILEVKRIGNPQSPPDWPVLYVSSIALAQLAAVNFSDFVALIRNALPTQEADLGRRRAAIVALAFGHLGLCKALLDDEEVPQCQRVAKLFQPTEKFCSFFCERYPDRLRLGGKFGFLMQAVVRGNSNHAAWAVRQQELPFHLEPECKHPRLTEDDLLRVRPSNGIERVLSSPIDAAIVRAHTNVLEELLSCLPKFDQLWDKYSSMRQKSLHLACLRGDFKIFEILLNVRHPARSYLREKALEAICQYGHSEFLRQYTASLEYGFTQELLRKNMERSVETAIFYHQSEYLVDFIAEIEKHNLNWGSLPMFVLQKAMVKKSLALLHSYLLARASSLARISRPFTSQEFWLLNEFESVWPEGRAVLVDEGILVGEEPRGLQTMCSAIVRGRLRHPVTLTVKQLPLPTMLKMRLLFKSSEEARSDGLLF